MTKRPDDLPSIQQLATGKPHGHKMRYVAGCRCWRCKRGNREYENKIRENRRLHGPNDLVPVDRTRTFLQKMQAVGIGYMTIARHVGVGKTALGEILWAGKTTHIQIRRRTETKGPGVPAQPRYHAAESKRPGRRDDSQALPVGALGVSESIDQPRWPGARKFRLTDRPSKVTHRHG